MKNETPMIECKVLDPGIDFAEIFRGSKFRFISQTYNGDGTYCVVLETDVLSNDTHEKNGVCRIEAKRLAVIGGMVIALGDYENVESEEKRWWENLGKGKRNRLK